MNSDTFRLALPKISGAIVNCSGLDDADAELIRNRYDLRISGELFKEEVMRLMSIKAILASDRGIFDQFSRNHNETADTTIAVQKIKQ